MFHSFLLLNLYFSVPKDVRLNSAHYLIMKTSNRKELKNIAINHSADIDFKDFMKLYRECTREPFNFLTTDITLPANNLENFFLIFIKMTSTDKLKIPDFKIKWNQAQYDLSGESVKISALSSKDLLEKYEYFTGEDLWYRPSALAKTKFEYSPSGAVLNNNTKKKTNTNKVNSKEKQEKYLVYNSHHSFTKFKNIDEFKELSLDSVYKKLNDFFKKLISLKMLIHKQMKIKSWSQRL